MTQPSVYDDIAKSALDQYGLTQAQCSFLGHSGSVTFRVEMPAEKFLLRIHQPVSSDDDDIWQQPEATESELLWLAALHHDTQLVVQQPIGNLDRRWITQVAGNEHTQTFYCSLLHWIEGELLQSEPTPQQAYRLGALVAQLHQHSQQWQIPPSFIRPAYDRHRFDAALAKLAPARSPGLISTEDYYVLGAAVRQIQGMMSTLEQARSWGLIHADLHDGNYLLHGDELRPLDFARCGFGYYLYDVASTLQYLPPTVRADFFDGYQTSQKLPENYIQIVEGCFILAIIDVLSFHVNNRLEHEGVSNTVKDLTQDHIPLYRQGESFLFDKY